MMSGIKGKDTKPEMLVRRSLFASGYRYRLHRRDLPGAPDIVLPGRKIAIFVHGCFWHLHRNCKYAKYPTTRNNFWREKLEGNVQRDLRAAISLGNAGWRVLVIWECVTRNPISLGQLSAQMVEWIEGENLRGEISGVHPA